MKLLDHLNLYFGYEAPNMKEFIKDFKEDFQVGGDNEGVTELLMFLNSYARNE